MALSVKKSKPLHNEPALEKNKHFYTAREWEAACWGVILTPFKERWTTSNSFVWSTNIKIWNKANPTNMMSNLPLCVSFFLFFSVCLVLPHLLASSCSLCLCHLWHQPAHRHLCQAWQPEPRRTAWLSSIDSFRQLHPDSDLYGGSLIYLSAASCFAPAIACNNFTGNWVVANCESIFF